MKKTLTLITRAIAIFVILSSGIHLCSRIMEEYNQVQGNSLISPSLEE